VAQRERRLALLDERMSHYPRRYCSVCDHVVEGEFRPGPSGRPDATCPRCGSLERHRFFALALSVLRPTLGDVDLLLDVAPSPQMSRSLASVGARRYVRVDLGADGRRVDVQASLTRLPHADRSVDLLVCYHVLEHVPDDLAAMREIARVLSDTGTALVQVPWRPGTVTDEDPDAPEDERVRRFGQADHVRYYGDDFEQRLASCGLSLRRITPRSLLGPHMVTWLRLVADEPVWVLRRTPDGAAPTVEPPPEDGSALERTFDAMLGEMTRLRARLADHRRQLAELQGTGGPAETGRTGDASVDRR
jgi:SAM-dependent methyltransferase